MNVELTEQPLNKVYLYTNKKEKCLRRRSPRGRVAGRPLRYLTATPTTSVMVEWLYKYFNRNNGIHTWINVNVYPGAEPP